MTARPISHIRSMIRALWSSKAFGRLLAVVSVFSAGFAVALSAGVYFGWLPDLAKESPVVSPFDVAASPVIAPTVPAPPSLPSVQNLPAPALNDDSSTSAYLQALLGKTPDSKTVIEIAHFDREGILSDVDQRVSDEFKIPKDLRDRAGFWFDVYSKYDANHRIIHHERYPWIVYKIIDVSPIIHAELPKHRWQRNQKAEKFVKSEELRIRTMLKNFASKKTSPKTLTPEEQEVADAIKSLGGDFHKQAALALKSVRVQTGQRNFFAEGLQISPRYLPTMERIFRAHKLPTELTRLPFVESSFNGQATSRVGASGIWQFMDGTGRKFLIVKGGIDERRSPFKASEAAAQLLKENHMILHRSWPLAITAWNHGPSGLRKAMKAAGSQNLPTIIARYHSKSFDFASSNFYSEFLGALYAEKYNREIFGEIEREPTMDLQELRLPRSLRLAGLIRASGLTREKFFELNPDLDSPMLKNASLPAGFKLHLPANARLGIERSFASSVASADHAS